MTEGFAHSTTSTNLNLKQSGTKIEKIQLLELIEMSKKGKKDKRKDKPEINQSRRQQKDTIVLNPDKSADPPQPQG